MNDMPMTAPVVPDPTLAERYVAVRQWTEHLAAALSDEDQCVQSMPDASPAKWHRAHITWFFEQFILTSFLPGYQVFDDNFRYLFNSYYEAVGPRHPRPARGLLTRPSVAEVTAYRAHVDAAMLRLLDNLPDAAAGLVELGLQHEQQHQELLLTDMLHAFAQNPLAPAVLPDWREPEAAVGATRLVACDGGMVQIGHRGDGFCFDNETPVHSVYLQPYRLASRLVRNSEWLAFIADGGYRTATLWMSDGWACAQAAGWTAPLYWREIGWRMVADGIARSRATRPGCARAPHQLVRGRCLRPLGRRAVAVRGRMGSRRRISRYRGIDRPCLAMDGQRLQSVPRLSPGRRRRRRIQREVHDQPDGAARGFVGDPGGSLATQLS